MLKIAIRDRCRRVLASLSDFQPTSRPFSDDGSSDDKKKAAAAKLQDLLSRLAQDNVEREKVDEVARVKVSHPPKRVVDNRPVYKIKLDKIPDPHTVKLVSAVKDVADHVGGTPEGVKSTEAELLHVILNNKKPDGKQVGDLKLENVISGMQVEKTGKSEEPKYSRAAQVRRNLPPERRERPPMKRDGQPSVGLNIFNEKPLGIFPANYVVSSQEPAELNTWSTLNSRDLRLRVTHPPKNIYEEMIRWTERGILWTFPIDNEQGWEKEKNTDFSEHVFLDRHLEPWCPRRGPVRKFMELVLIGLSKNPYITVDAKIEHIMWFRDYFEEKRKVLLETGSLPDEVRPQEITSS